MDKEEKKENEFISFLRGFSKAIYKTEEETNAIISDWVGFLNSLAESKEERDEKSSC